MAERYHVVQTPGHNSRLDEVQAEILRRKPRRLGDYIAGRRAVAARYAEALAGTDLVLPNIALNISYPWPVHTMTGFAKLGYSAGSLPVPERVAALLEVLKTL